jgi:hypothetical protein
MRTISNRDKKIIIWSFMEELCDKYLHASENNLPTYFNVKDFCNVGILARYLLRIDVTDLNGSSGGALILDTLSKYAERKGFIKVEGDILKLTENGIAERKKSRRGWD